MPKYLCIQRSGEGGACEPPSPDQMEKMYAKFQAWKEKFKDNLVDLGSPLDKGGRVVTADAITDGPFAESKEIVGGYMIISADNFEEAVKVVQESPGVGGPGSSVEVRELRQP